MSDFMDMMVELLPLHSPIQDKSNDLRRVLDKTMGSYMDTVESPFEGLFLTSASGGWLDAFGADYGVPRKLDETDEDYRERIIFEKNDKLTAVNLLNLYDVDLFAYVSGFVASENMLTSDNPYVSNFYIGVADESTQNILNDKFILGEEILWYTGEKIDFIDDVNDRHLLKKYLTIYDVRFANNYFKNNTSIKKVRLTIPNCRQGAYMFAGCTNLENVSFSMGVSSPSIYAYNPLDHIFDGCTNLKTIDVVIPTSPAITQFKNYVIGLNLTNLTSFKINGVEYID